jgi:hypothetical protein
MQGNSDLWMLLMSANCLVPAQLGANSVSTFNPDVTIERLAYP